MRRRRREGRDPVLVGAVLLVVIAIGVYLGFSKDIPIVNPPFQIKAAFRDTSGLNAHSPVRIAGVEVGKVTKVEHMGPGSTAALVTMTIKNKGRPIHTDATAKIRPRIFLEGNFFVELGAGSPSAPDMKDGATIPVTRTANAVQLDQVLSSLQTDTRGHLQQIFKELAADQDAGGAKAYNDSLPDQPPAFKYTAIASDALLGKGPRDLSDWIRGQGRAFQAADSDPVKFRALITNFERTAAALADRQNELRAAVAELPATLNAAVPAFTALDAAFPDVKRFAVAALPGVRSTGPAVDAALPLVRQLRGLVQPGELRGLSRDLRATTPSLARLTRDSVPVLTQVRALSSCTATTLVPFGNETVGDPNFPAHGPVHEELPQFLPGLAGESRSFDANGPWFKVLGTGGAETLNLGNGLFGTTLAPIVGVNPPPVRTRPPLEPGAPCENQETPDLSSTPVKGPIPVNTDSSSAVVRERTAKARAVAIGIARDQLKAQHSSVKVSSTDVTLSQIEQLARHNGLLDQLNKTLKAAHR